MNHPHKMMDMHSPRDHFFIKKRQQVSHCTPRGPIIVYVLQMNIIISVTGNGVRNCFQSDRLIIMLQYQEVVLYFGWMPLVNAYWGRTEQGGDYSLRPVRRYTAPCPQSCGFSMNMTMSSHTQIRRSVERVGRLSTNTICCLSDRGFGKGLC